VKKLYLSQEVHQGDTFTISRGEAGSAAVTHSTGATVKHVLTSSDLNSFEAGSSDDAGGTITGLLLMGG
jgi:hypothetical protein